MAGSATAFAAVCAESSAGTSTVIVSPVSGSTLVTVLVSFEQEDNVNAIRAIAVRFYIKLVFEKIK